MPISPVCLVKDGAGSFVETANGVNVTPGNQISVMLKDASGIVSWTLEVIGTDELSTVPTMTNVDATTNLVASPSAVVTFTFPAGAGRAMGLRSTVTGDVNPDPVTFGLYAPTDSLARVGFFSETTESDAKFGWLSKINQVIRGALSSVLTLGNRDTPTAEANKVKLYAQNVNGISELFVLDSADNEIQVTSNGFLALDVSTQSVETEVFVDSAQGQDSNDGSQAHPYATLGRALSERSNILGPLRAQFTIRLVGAGPYAMPSRFVANPVEMDGRLSITGDLDSPLLNGTFSSSLDDATNTIIVTQTLQVADQYTGCWLWVTSGALQGTIVLITANDASHSITVANAVDWDAIAPGDGYAIGRPLTVVQCAGAVIDSNGNAASGNLATEFVACHFTGSGLNIFNSSIQMSACLIDTPVDLFGTALHTGESIGSTWRSNVTLSGQSSLTGVVVTTAGELTAGVEGSGASVSLLGGRVAGSLRVEGGVFEIVDELGLVKFDTTLEATDNALVRFPENTRAQFAVSSGSAIRLTNGARLVLESEAVTGGTSDPAGYGIDATGGGIVNFVVPSTLEGGASNQEYVADPVLTAHVLTLSPDPATPEARLFDVGEGLLVTSEPDKITVSFDPAALQQMILSEDQTFHIDPVNGDDAQAGDEGHPWQTIDRFHQYLMQFICINALVTAVIHPSDPNSGAQATFTSIAMPRFGANGNVIYRGTDDWETFGTVTAVTGTDSANSILAVDNYAGTTDYAGYMIYCTSGANAGTWRIILENTVANGGDPATFDLSAPLEFDGVGDTWEIRRPGVTIGGTVSLLNCGLEYFGGVYFIGVRMLGIMLIESSQVYLYGVECSADGINSDDSTIQAGDVFLFQWSDSYEDPNLGETKKVFGWGLTQPRNLGTRYFLFGTGTFFSGVAVGAGMEWSDCNVELFGGHLWGIATCQLEGGRTFLSCEAPTLFPRLRVTALDDVGGSPCIVAGYDADCQVGFVLLKVTGQTATAALFRAKTGGIIYGGGRTRQVPHLLPQPIGTTGGYAQDVSGGGRILWSEQPPSDFTGAQGDLKAGSNTAQHASDVLTQEDSAFRDNSGISWVAWVSPGS